MAKILLIDDDPQVLRILATCLEGEHHDVATATNGREGIRQLQSGPFQVVVTDIIMPEQDGYELLLWLRQQPGRPKTVAMTGGSAKLGPEQLLKIAQHFADRVLVKPFPLEDLTATVNELAGFPHPRGRSLSGEAGAFQ